MKKIVNRLIQCILTLFIVSVLCFALTKAAPGDPVLTYVEPNMSEEYIQNLRESLGLTKPLYEQYFLWLGRILHGNFGNSLMNNRPVLTQMLELSSCNCDPDVNQYASGISHCHCPWSVFRKKQERHPG